MRISGSSIDWQHSCTFFCLYWRSHVRSFLFVLKKNCRAALISIICGFCTSIMKSHSYWIRLCSAFYHVLYTVGLSTTFFFHSSDRELELGVHKSVTMDIFPFYSYWWPALTSNKNSPVSNWPCHAPPHAEVTFQLVLIMKVSTALWPMTFSSRERQRGHGFILACFHPFSCHSLALTCKTDTATTAACSCGSLYFRGEGSEDLSDIWLLDR